MNAKPSLSIPAYERAQHRVMNLIMDVLASTDPVLGAIPVRSTGHAGPTRNVPGPNPVDHPLSEFSERFYLHADTIKGTDTETYLLTLIDLGKTYRERLGRTFFETTTDIAEAVGNAIDARGLPLSWDRFLDAIELIDVSFDREGRASGLQVIMHPETHRLMNQVPRTPEHDERFNDIMRRKKDHWDAQQRPRRLPRQGR